MSDTNSEFNDSMNNNDEKIRIMSSQSSSTTQWSLDGDRSAFVTVLPRS